MYLSNNDFSKVISLTPLVSIDLCILKDKKMLLGKRLNSPAKDFFFVPGGRILKSELIENALKRILRNELGMNFKNQNHKFIKNLGIFEHFYDDNFFNEDFGTHYIVLAYMVKYDYLIKIEEEIINQQHSKYIWIEIDSFINSPYKIHKNTLEYFKNPLITNCGE